MKRNVFQDGNGSGLVMVEGLGEYAPMEQVAELKSEIARLQAQNKNLYQEAVIHAHEARAQRSTVHDIYQALGIQKGDWNGKKPVVEKFAEVEQERDQLKEIQFVSQCDEVDVIRCLKTLAYEHNHADVPRYQALAKRVMDKYVVRGTEAKASLAAHDAEVIRQTFSAAYRAGFDHGLKCDQSEIESANRSASSISLYEYQLQHIARNAAEQYIRQQAKEVQS